MRIALVTAEHDPIAAVGRDGAGHDARLRDLAVALADAGHDVTVEARRDAGGGRPEVRLGTRARVRYTRAAPSGTAPVRALPAFADALTAAWRDAGPDVVHADGWLSGLAAGTAARRLRIPLVVGSRGATAPSRTRLAAERTVARQADRFVVSSGDERLRLVRAGTRLATITLVPQGIDTELFTPDGAALRRDGRHRIVTVGGLGPDSGVADTVTALRYVPDTELLAAGGPDAGGCGDPDLRRLGALAARHGVADRVRFLGAVPHDVLPRLLRSADVVVHVPRAATSGAAVLEAMASGRPVVASSVGPVRETVVDQVTGVLVPPGRPEVLAATLRGLLRRPTTMFAFGTAGRDRALSRYTWPVVARDVERCYRDALGDQPDQPDESGC